MEPTLGASKEEKGRLATQALTDHPQTPTRFRLKEADQIRGATHVIKTAAQTTEQSTFPARRILLVEDNRDGRETMRVLLELLGHRVISADDGPSGLAKALTSAPEVALLDIGLPGMDGYQLARQLRYAFGRSIYLIAHTGYGQPDDRRRAFEAGFNAHLVKPVDLNELVSLLTWLPGKLR